MFKAPLVIGYKGEIGSYILNRLLKVMPKALDILCYDINETEVEKIERIQKADIIFLCLPIDETINWFNTYSMYLVNKTIVEQTSLKEEFEKPENLWLKQCSFKIDHVHLLFRPSSTPDKKDRRCAFVLSMQTEIDKLIDLFDCSDHFIYHSIKEHDEDMAINQALLHRTLICLSNTMNQEGKTFIGGKVVELANRIKLVDKNLFNKIQNSSYVENVIENFKKELDKPIDEWYNK